MPHSLRQDLVLLWWSPTTEKKKTPLLKASLRMNHMMHCNDLKLAWKGALSTFKCPWWRIPTIGRRNAKQTKVPARCERAHVHSTITWLKRRTWLTDAAVAMAIHCFLSPSSAPLRHETFRSVHSSVLGSWCFIFKTLHYFLICAASSDWRFQLLLLWEQVWSAVLYFPTG